MGVRLLPQNHAAAPSLSPPPLTSPGLSPATARAGDARACHSPPADILRRRLCWISRFWAVREFSKLFWFRQHSYSASSTNRVEGYFWSEQRATFKPGGRLWFDLQGLQEPGGSARPLRG